MAPPSSSSPQSCLILSPLWHKGELTSWVKPSLPKSKPPGVLGLPGSGSESPGGERTGVGLGFGPLPADTYLGRRGKSLGMEA